MENKMVTVDEESSELDCEDQKQRNETKKLLKPVMGEKMLAEKRWAILDVEFIRTSPSHRCIRKLYILTHNGFDMEMEFHPCRSYQCLQLKYQRSYQFCRKHIHKLPYTPRRVSPSCRSAVPKLNEFVVNNDIDLILYKGGTIENELCNMLDIKSLNIESMDVEKAYSHDPREEVNFYYNQLMNICNQ